MTGRTGSSFKSRGGSAGRGGGPGRGSGSGSRPKTKTLSDHVYSLGTARQVTDYEVTTSYLCNHITKTFEYGSDISTALEVLQDTDFTSVKPSLKFSTETGEVKKAENRQYEIEFKADYDAFTKRKQLYAMNMHKAYAFLWEQCARPLQYKIEARDKYHSTIKNKPIELLKAIKEHALNYQEHRYPVSVVLESLRILLGVRQREGEALAEYAKRFKTARDILESHLGGPVQLTKYAQTLPKWDVNNPNDGYKEAHNHLIAYLFIDQSDRKKYGTMIQGLQSQQSLGNDQYPKSLASATHILNNHRWDKQTHNWSDPSKKKQSAKTGDSPNEETKEDSSPAMSFAMEGKCFCCGATNHMSSKCKHKSRPKSEWFINKFGANAEDGDSSTDHGHSQVETSDDQTKDDESVSEQSADQPKKISEKLKTPMKSSRLLKLDPEEKLAHQFGSEIRPIVLSRGHPIYNPKLTHTKSTHGIALRLRRTSYI